MLLLSPMAAIARIMKNLLSSLSGVNTSAGAPSEVQIVVKIDAQMNHKMNIGKLFLRLKPPSPLPAFLAYQNERASVMGIIASVRVSLTVTALSSV